MFRRKRKRLHYTQAFSPAYLSLYCTKYTLYNGSALVTTLTLHHTEREVQFVSYPLRCRSTIDRPTDRPTSPFLGTFFSSWERSSVLGDLLPLLVRPLVRRAVPWTGLPLEVPSVPGMVPRSSTFLGNVLQYVLRIVLRIILRIVLGFVLRYDRPVDSVRAVPRAVQQNIFFGSFYTASMGLFETKFSGSFCSTFLGSFSSTFRPFVPRAVHRVALGSTPSERQACGGAVDASRFSRPPLFPREGARKR